MSRDYKLSIRDMRAAAARILAKTAGVTLDGLLADRDLQDIVQLNLIKLGEAAKLIPDDVRAAHPGIDWRRAAGMRDRLVHAYFGVKWELVLGTINADLPPLVGALDAMIAALDDHESPTDGRG